MSFDPVGEELSPDGRTLVRWVESDGRMSHVIRTPTILDAAGGGTILRFGDSGFDGAIDWGADGGFEIDLRHYWRPGNLRLSVDRAGGTFCRLNGEGACRSHPLGEISEYVEAYFVAAAAGLEAQAGADAREKHVMRARERRGKLRALWATLALGACTAIWALYFRR
jgi:hypothetical protein